jgi:predicted RNA-binding Zn-ribbon protein involved in translation (DUF1610 family)
VVRREKGTKRRPTMKTKNHVFKMSQNAYEAMSEEYGGYCVACGAEAYGVEPDARKYSCDACGEPAVYGVEELLLMGKVIFKGTKAA